MTSWTAPDLTKFAVDDKAPVISDILDLGNNRLAITLYYSNRDSAAVVFSDYSFSTVSAPVFDSRIGGIYGAWRSARYAMGGVADDGTAYVFCGTSADGSKVGALRIKKGATSFDPDYKFDIYTASEGYRFRKAYPISGSKFLLEFYVDKDAYSNMSTSGKLAIADMDAKTLTWVTGVLLLLTWPTTLLVTATATMATSICPSIPQRHLQQAVAATGITRRWHVSHRRLCLQYTR